MPENAKALFAHFCVDELALYFQDVKSYFIFSLLLDIPTLVWTNAVSSSWHQAGLNLRLIGGATELCDLLYGCLGKCPRLKRFDKEMISIIIPGICRRNSVLGNYFEIYHLRSKEEKVTHL